MQKELEMWKEENKQHQIALKRERRFELEITNDFQLFLEKYNEIRRKHSKRHFLTFLTKILLVPVQYLAPTQRCFKAFNFYNYSITESEVLPLKSHLTEMEGEVEEMV